MPQLMNIGMPPSLSGDEAQQIAMLRSYLYQTVEQLNVALAHVTEQRAPVQGAVIPVTQPSPDSSKVKEELKALIVKTADIVREFTLEKIGDFRTEVASEYTALSDFGEYVEHNEAQYNQAVDGLTLALSRIENVRGSEGYQWSQDVKGYIKLGTVNDDGVLKTGIAIGDQIRVTNGRIQTEGKTLAIYTSDGLGFWINGTKTAWFTNNTMYISDAYIQHTMTMGSKYQWAVSEVLGLTLKYIGG